MDGTNARGSQRPDSEWDAALRRAQMSRQSRKGVNRAPLDVGSSVPGSVWWEALRRAQKSGRHSSGAR